MIGSGGLGDEEVPHLMLRVSVCSAVASVAPLSWADWQQQYWSNGRLQVAMNGCSVDAKRERAGPERQAALEKLGGRVWVGSRDRREESERGLYVGQAPLAANAHPCSRSPICCMARSADVPMRAGTGPVIRTGRRSKPKANGGRAQRGLRFVSR